VIKLLIATVGGLAFLATSPTLKERSDGRKNVAGVPTTTHATQSTYQPKPYMVIRGSDGSVKVYEERQDGTLSPIPNPATELVKAAEGVVAGRELYK